MVWTSVVAAVVCTIFMGLLLYLVNESNIEDRLEKAASHSLYSLEAVIKEQSIEMQKLRAENKKIHDYLLLWTPMDAQRRATERCKIFEKGTWDKGPNILFRSQKLPSYIPNSTNTCQEGNLCLPFLEYIVLVIFVHELGHYAAARACGVAVDSFSIGFGKVLLKKELWGTEWRLSLIPFGGYIKPRGENDYDNIKNDSQSFWSASPWRRAFIAVMGPVFNLLLPWPLYFAVASRTALP